MFVALAWHNKVITIRADRLHARLQVKTLGERASQLERECAELQLQLAQERRQAKDAANAAQSKLTGALRRIQYLVRNVHEC